MYIENLKDKQYEVSERTFSMKKERLMELDVMRGIAFLFIVLQHTIGGFSYRDDISFNDFVLAKFIYTAAQVGVVMFMFLTAVSLVYTYSEKFNIKDFYIKKLKFLILPFVLWSLIIMLNDGDPIDYQSGLVIFSGAAQYHLWYMGMIIRVYLYFPIILWMINKVKEKNIYLKASIFVLLTYLYWFVLSHYGIADFISSHIFKNPNDLQKKLVNISPIFYFLYFVVGIYAVCNYKKFKAMILKYKYTVSLIYAFCFGFYYYIALSERWIGLPKVKGTIAMSILFRISSVLFFYLISCIIAQKLPILLSMLKTVSRYSFPAYLIHVMILNKLTGYISTTPEITSYIKYFVATVFISIGVSAFINYIPYSEYLMGVKSRRLNIIFSKTAFRKAA
ncbi:acyltransferase [uncultured Clostridium sp.]|uniref:acyltransferase n=1 Tax=uncultured Clostridium sp. TaxID=59620 RepID=UPI0025F4C83C|nr:acyltransferase [uncultured Clostridium sp.]